MTYAIAVRPDMRLPFVRALEYGLEKGTIRGERFAEIQQEGGNIVLKVAQRFTQVNRENDLQRALRYAVSSISLALWLEEVTLEAMAETLAKEKLAALFRRGYGAIHSLAEMPENDWYPALRLPNEEQQLFESIHGGEFGTEWTAGAHYESERAKRMEIQRRNNAVREIVAHTSDVQNHDGTCSAIFASFLLSLMWHPRHPTPLLSERSAGALLTACEEGRVHFDKASRLLEKAASTFSPATGAILESELSKLLASGVPEKLRDTSIPRAERMLHLQGVALVEISTASIDAEIGALHAEEEKETPHARAKNRSKYKK